MMFGMNRPIIANGFCELAPKIDPRFVTAATYLPLERKRKPGEVTFVSSKRRERHRTCEQRRRDRLKEGFERLKDLLDSSVPATAAGAGSILAAPAQGAAAAADTSSTPPPPDLGELDSSGAEDDDSVSMSSTRSPLPAGSAPHPASGGAAGKQARKKFDKAALISKAAEHIQQLRTQQETVVRENQALRDQLGDSSAAAAAVQHSLETENEMLRRDLVMLRAAMDIVHIMKSNEDSDEGEGSGSSSPNLSSTEGCSDTSPSPTLSSSSSPSSSASYLDVPSDSASTGEEDDDEDDKISPARMRSQGSSLTAAHARVLESSRSHVLRISALIDSDQRSSYEYSVSPSS